MCECGRRTGDRIGLISKVHGCDETAVHGEYVENLAIRKNIPLKALDELVHPDAGLASIFLGHRKRFDIRIELTALPALHGRAACSTVRVPWKLLRSVAVNPGHAALTLMPVDSRAMANANVTALRAVFDTL
jgi:hypothetical protein